MCFSCCCGATCKDSEKAISRWSHALHFLYFDDICTVHSRNVQWTQAVIFLFYCSSLSILCMCRFFVVWKSIYADSLHCLSKTFVSLWRTALGNNTSALCGGVLCGVSKWFSWRASREAVQDIVFVRVSKTVVLPTWVRTPVEFTDSAGRIRDYGFPDTTCNQLHDSQTIWRGALRNWAFGRVEWPSQARWRQFRNCAATIALGRKRSPCVRVLQRVQNSISFFASTLVLCMFAQSLLRLLRWQFMLHAVFVCTALTQSGLQRWLINFV